MGRAFFMRVGSQKSIANLPVQEGEEDFSRFAIRYAGGRDHSTRLHDGETHQFELGSKELLDGNHNRRAPTLVSFQA